VARQAPRGSHSGAGHEAEVHWAELVCRLVPSAQRVRFTASMPEATLLALRWAGDVNPTSPVYRRAVIFLLRTQKPDGSWLVRSRSRPFQTYLESGFPHGKDQFISAAASGYAAAALALTLPRERQTSAHTAQEDRAAEQ
jgi:hypothetical protein